MNEQQEIQEARNAASELSWMLLSAPDSTLITNNDENTSKYMNKLLYENNNNNSSYSNNENKFTNNSTGEYSHISSSFGNHLLQNLRQISIDEEKIDKLQRKDAEILKNIDSSHDVVNYLKLINRSNNNLSNNNNNGPYKNNYRNNSKNNWESINQNNTDDNSAIQIKNNSLLLLNHLFNRDYNFIPSATALITYSQLSQRAIYYILMNKKKKKKKKMENIFA